MWQPVCSYAAMWLSYRKNKLKKEKIKKKTHTCIVFSLPSALTPAVIGGQVWVQVALENPRVARDNPSWWGGYSWTATTTTPNHPNASNFFAIWVILNLLSAGVSWSLWNSLELRNILENAHIIWILKTICHLVGCFASSFSLNMYRNYCTFFFGTDRFYHFGNLY